jgi:hypothetical protein
MMKVANKIPVTLLTANPCMAAMVLIKIAENIAIPPQLGIILCWFAFRWSGISNNCFLLDTRMILGIAKRTTAKLNEKLKKSSK